MNIIETNLQFGALDRRNSTHRIILHNSGVSVLQSVEVIHNYHKSLSWSGIGYHLYVRKDGSIYRGRPIWAVGAHAGGSNYDSIGVCFEGNFDEETMGQAQLNAGKELVAYLKKEYGISKVQGHRDVGKTSCPGNNFPFDEIANASEVPAEPTTPVEGKIATIQRTINERYGFNIAVDNIFGNETKTALVKALQTELNTQVNRGLSIDGIFGARTKAGCINVRKGATGYITWLIQAMLVCKGYDIEVDGIFGNNTEWAVRDFQSKNGLTADGICGKNTFEKLFR